MDLLAVQGTLKSLLQHHSSKASILWHSAFFIVQLSHPYMTTGIKIAGRNINNLRYAEDTTLMAESEEELKSLLVKVKEESEKVGLKLNIQKSKIIASGTITSWQIDEEAMETVTDFIFSGSKITVDGDCSHETKRGLPLGRKAMTNLNSTLESRDITLSTKAYVVKAMVFPVVMYGCEGWTTQKADHLKLMLLNCGVGEDS